MFNPYVLMTFLYLALAVLGALDASLVNFQFLPAFAGLRWIRVHLITLGALTEFAFGILPLVAAARIKLPRPQFRWDIWLTLNLGLLILLVGIPMINGALITIGGGLIFAAAILLIIQLGQLRDPGAVTHPSGRTEILRHGARLPARGYYRGTGLWQAGARGCKSSAD
ncbi:MAG: hypothetical protein IPK17_15990 [Chloroflexi bacterium]|uniref:hypothetical protein n=1 Tax=Candidatus Flexifilum breve TaxID=3140694 RepID=UPI003136D27D|nr:hypothetical protein [Chloroflexota bacterium]